MQHLSWQTNVGRLRKVLTTDAKKTTYEILEAREIDFLSKIICRQVLQISRRTHNS
jgi:hypothetical protein